jgi:hypothetical protein
MNCFIGHLIQSVCLLTPIYFSVLKHRLATGWTVRGSNPGEGAIFRTRPDQLWGPPSLLYNGHWVFFREVEGLGRDVDHLPLI